MIAEHRHLVSQGAKLVELRLDYINGQLNLKRLLAESLARWSSRFAASDRRRQMARERKTSGR